jgi:hypothetical protein
MSINSMNALVPAPSDRAGEDNAAWGELREGLHIAGYSFDRACRRLEALLEGDGWKVGGRFKDLNDFLDSLSFDNLSLTLANLASPGRAVSCRVNGYGGNFVTVSAWPGQ